MRGSKLRKGLGLALMTGGLVGCSLLSPLPRESTLADRLAVFPTDDLPLNASVAVYWNDQQIPFIVAESDDDLAFTLGLVHAHLRLGQMEILRRISQGRLSEMAGPLAIDIDRSLRILGYGRSAEAVLAAMPEATRLWIDAFVAGLNHYQARTAVLPHEYRLLGFEREPWTAADILTIGRLASTDVNWLVWARLLGQRDREDWPALWARLVRNGTTGSLSIPDDEATTQAALMRVFTDFNRMGSNSLAVAAERSSTGAALIASDPHLGLSLPNLWLLAGYRSPSYNAVGLMVPGLPFVAVGRNPWIAWGGTNMRSANSDLFDASDLAANQITERREPIRVRWWRDGEAVIRETPYGPLISDAPFLDAGDSVLALQWIGHRSSDEMTAMLRINAARNWEDFRAALAGFAIAPQNMVYADAEGNIGMVLATHLPARNGDLPDDMIRELDDAAAWETILTSEDLPYTWNPTGGVIGSANNRPANGPVPIGYFFSPSDRIDRIYEMTGGDGTISIDVLAAVQQDVYMASAVALRNALLARLDRLALKDRLSARQAAIVAAMRQWDGHYREDSSGALAFQLIAFHFAHDFYAPRDRVAFEAASQLFQTLEEDMAEAGDARVEAGLEYALRASEPSFAEFRVWGEIHRLRLAHALRILPVIGSRYEFGEFPAAGATATLMKTSASLTDQRHNAGYGSNARHISDLSDPDRNLFVLLGGQDGWLNSSTFIDQVALWRRGEYVEVPLRAETAARRFPHRMTLTPR